MNNVPKIRFPGFTEPWEQRKLSECVDYYNGSGHEDYVKAEGRYELITLKSINSEGKLVSSEKYVDEEFETLRQGTIIMMLSEQAKGMLGMTTIIPCNNKYILNQRVAELRLKDGFNSLFMTKAINEKQSYFEQMGAGTKVQNITKGHVENCLLYVPQIEEQTQVGEFFLNLDNLITLHQRKCDKVKELKKAMLQKMFPKNGEKKPEIRFPGFIDDWEQRKFSDVFTGLQNNTLSRSELNYESGTVKNVHYGDVLIKFGDYIDASKEELPFINDDSKVEKFKGSFLHNGDIIIADTAEDETVGKCTEIQGVHDIKLLSGLHTIPCRPKEEYGAKFLGYYMNSSAYHAQLIPLMQGIKVTSISKSALQDTDMIIPKSVDEQTIIGEYFSNLDNLITLHQRKCDKLIELKKSMLQKMFI